MTDKQINRWLRKEFRPISWILIFYYLFLNLLVSLVAVVDAAKQMLRNAASGNFLMDVDVDSLMNNAWGYILCIFLGVILLHAWKGPDYWREEIFQKGRKMTPVVFFCAMVFCVGSQMVNSLWLTGLELVMNLFDASLMPMLEAVSGSSGSFSMFLYASFLGPIAEELLFRGVVLRQLRPWGKQTAILVSAIAFGLFHGNVIQIPFAFMVGLVLGYVTVEYSIFWAIVLHVFNNFVLSDLIGRLSEISPEGGSVLLMLILVPASVVAIVQLILKRKQLGEYLRQNKMGKISWRGLLASPFMWIYTGLMLISCLLTITRI